MTEKEQQVLLEARANLKKFDSLPKQAPPWTRAESAGMPAHPSEFEVAG